MSKNYCVIMAGGIGSRFWPMSTEEQPKQFLDIMGTGKSFIRATFERFLSIIPKENFLVVTSAKYKQQVLDHIPELNENQVLLEPMRRNTAPCVAYASFRIRSQCSDANIVVAPSDHFITNGVEFERIISLGLDYVSKHPTLLTIGIKPSRPETGYGYIKQGQLSSGVSSEVYVVDSFKEKPELAVAESYVASGDYLWNSGIFLWNVNTILHEFERQLPNMYSDFDRGVYDCGVVEQKFIDGLYPDCQNISIDYGILEHALSRSVIPADFGWSDIGTWGSLYTHLPKDNRGNAAVGAKVVFEDASNCLVNIPGDNKAIVQGISDCLVAYHGGNLIVCKMSQEQDIKHWIEKLQ